MNHIKAFLIYDENGGSVNGSTNGDGLHNCENTLKYSGLTPQRFINVEFNSDSTYFTSVIGNNLKIYKTYPLKLMANSYLPETYIIFKSILLGRTNLIVLLLREEKQEPLSLKIPRKAKGYTVKIWDEHQHKIVWESTCEVLDFYVSSESYLILTTINHELLVYKFITADKDHSSAIIQIQIPNIKIRNDVAASVSRNLFTFSNAKIVGQVQVAKLPDMKSMSIFKAHKNNIRSLAISPNGEYLASCSERGTLIRIFKLYSGGAQNTIGNTNENYNKGSSNNELGTLLYEFRRGLEIADVYEIKWSPDSKKIACISDKCTLHIFQLPLLKKELMKRKKNVFLLTDMCNIKLSSTIPGDRCKIGWEYPQNDSIKNNSDTFYLIWHKSGLWQKFYIMKDYNDSKYEIVRENYKLL
ncbi:uncharacterized protein SCODWIG_00097 [Saccharomycodes ludwigii]|uniref:SVP1-like protein 2 n=1 Tax=Saccharomycodes ludwigii TaxID=36035 RepID=A0A376B0X0_9ASCO|nr:hypothetical protein SCDLUD_004508 [Saccharomycodes ludwigii]KAH3899084.1 hypothetical protein SCDLUD_004508 [Saccharomycodes ludwigii]SSD58336.1 uncharacterized protein SCODWIG_00097 [Saccharomycodes ludwigii]